MECGSITSGMACFASTSHPAACTPDFFLWPGNPFSTNVVHCLSHSEAPMLSDVTLQVIGVDVAFSRMRLVPSW